MPPDRKTGGPSDGGSARFQVFRSARSAVGIFGYTPAGSRSGSQVVIWPAMAEAATT